MLAINPDGFFLKADNDKPVYVKFPELAKSPGSVRKMLVDMTNHARGALSESA
jgi:putative heme iron utilization protein